MKGLRLLKVDSSAWDPTTKSYQIGQFWLNFIFDGVTPSKPFVGMYPTAEEVVADMVVNADIAIIHRKPYFLSAPVTK
jgi:hypothetical protein